jgi:hypothetical protein
MPHQKISNGTVIMVQEEFVKAWYYCYQGLDSMLVEVGSTTCADIIKEYYLEVKNTNKNTNK